MEDVNNVVSVLLESSTSDVGSVDYTSGGTRVQNLVPATRLFCDNFILWQVGDEINMRRFIRDNLHLTNFNVSLVSEGVLQGNDFGVAGDTYRSYKVSVSQEMIDSVINCLSLLPMDGVYLHDTDMTVGCYGIVTRQDLNDHLLRMGVRPEDIVDDLRKVGRNCISWYFTTSTGVVIRIKVYNKFIQMLECPNVRKNIGSIVHHIVANPSDEFQRTLLNASPYGLTRVEIKIYSQQVYNRRSYARLMRQTLGFISGCRVYQQSFENQWKLLVDHIFDKPVVMVYDRDHKIFGYCHWCNLLTSRIQGVVKKNIEPEEIPFLLSNFSFNGRYIRYIDLSGGVRTDEQYHRLTDGDTLVPGKNGSLYPSIVLKASFNQMGLIDYRDMRLGLPTQMRVDRVSMLSEVWRSGSSEMKMLGNNIITSSYRAMYTTLSLHTEYLVIAAGTGVYSGSQYIFAKLYNETERVVYHVRCNSSLEGMIANNGDVFRIMTGRTRRVRGYTDIEVRRI